MSTMSAENNSIKRRKIDGSAPTDAVCCLTDLPKEALIHVTTFLAAPSRALFAASLDGSSGSSDENISAIFPSNQLVGSGGPVNFREISAQLAKDYLQKILWEMEALNQTDILDFGRISKELVVQLCDDGIKAILLCVDAVNTVKRLKLANCIGITGVGLEPLRGPIIIQQIDLSLVEKQMSPSIDPEPPISCDAALPILDSIISQNECALKHLQFPEKWQRAREFESEWVWEDIESEWVWEDRRDPQFLQFISGYDEMLTNRGGVRCLQCNENLPRQGGEWMYGRYGRDGDIRQNYTCYECLKNYCHECEDEHGNSVLTSCCGLCKRMYCQQCERMNWCHGCDDFYCASCRELTECIECGENSCSKCCRGCCSGCGDVFCFYGCGPHQYDCRGKHCNKVFCSDCQPQSCLECERCDFVLCNECNMEIGANTVTFCEDCDTHYCGTCRVR